MRRKKDFFIQSSKKQLLISLQIPCSSSDASVWMEQTIAELEMGDNTKSNLIIPQRMTQQHKLEDYSIDACREDQKEVLSYILQYFKTWYESNKTPDSLREFTPLRMTLCGVAGSGKSTLINTLVTAIRKITQKTNSVYVCGPTGSAAFNAGGETCHRLFHIQTKLYNSELTSQALRNLVAKLKDTVALIVDERSMVSALLLGTMEDYCRQAAFEGTNNDLSWGGLPMVIVVGDDYQLPPIDEGAFHCFGQRARQFRTKIETAYVQKGMELFLEFGRDVMTLDKSKRVLEGQVKLQHILDGVRGSSDKSLSEQDAEYLCSLHIDNKNSFNQQDKQQIKKNALFLFANVEAKNTHNFHALKEINTPDNPVAVIRAVTKRIKDNARSRNIAHYDNERTPVLINIAQNSQVQLTGTNLCPKWGLYHGARGKVLDIVYHPEHSPPEDLPLYVLLDIPQYCGPAYIEGHPTVVPIAPIKVPCKNAFCCCRTYIPLRLAFAQTIHTFQGQNAGPVETGQTPNAVQKLVCDPGTRRFEGNCVGLFYTLLSRVTTFGNPLDKFSSAIYFTGTNMNKERVLNIALNEKGHMYAMAEKREQYVSYLHKHEHDSQMNKVDQMKILEWTKSWIELSFSVR